MLVVVIIHWPIRSISDIHVAVSYVWHIVIGCHYILILFLIPLLSVPRVNWCNAEFFYSNTAISEHQTRGSEIANLSCQNLNTHPTNRVVTLKTINSKIKYLFTLKFTIILQRLCFNLLKSGNKSNELQRKKYSRFQLIVHRLIGAAVCLGQILKNKSLLFTWNFA